MITGSETLTYILLQEKINLGFHINPNSQSLQLGDGVTMINLLGKMNIHLYRNSNKLHFQAIVVFSLPYPVIRGKIFIKDNNIKQYFVSLLGNKCNVPNTQRETLLPISQHNNTIPNTNTQLISVDNFLKIVSPNQFLTS